MLILCGKAQASSSWVKPSETLTRHEKINFWVGFSLFRSPWVAAPASTTGRDGLGPLFNARSCDACHKNGGSGDTPGLGFGSVLRLSVFDKELNRFVDDPVYGDQLQTLSITSMTGAEEMPAEGRLDVEWEDVTLVWRDKRYTLKKPRLVLSSLAYADISEGVKMSLRQAPSLFALGMVDLIPDSYFLSGEDITDQNQDGISGKVNRVWDKTLNKRVIGRFGHKAEQPTLLQQTAAAFHADIGISSWLFPQQNCTQAQMQCLQAVNGNSAEEGVEISREKLALVTAFTAQLKTPPTVILNTNNQGYRLFKETGCADCHRDAAVTIGGTKTAVFFSDFLLHDMGEGLSDDRPIFEASAREWRTPMLWGLSRKLQRKAPVSLMHDGRASSVEEAILWHQGEALKARNEYLAMEEKMQRQLIDFVSRL